MCASFLFAALLFVLQVSATCSLTMEDWTEIKQSFAAQDYVANFTQNGHCDNTTTSTSLLNKYSACGDTLNTVLTTQFSLTAVEELQRLMTNAFPDTPQAAITRNAQSWSVSPLGMLIRNTLCDYKYFPTCPHFSGLGAFAGISGCLWGNATLQGMTREEYFATQSDISGCTERSGPATFCVQFQANKNCPASVRSVFTYLYSDSFHSCEQAFWGAEDVEQRCLRSWRDTYLYYCPPVTSSIADTLLMGIGIPILCLGLLLLLCYARRHRAHLISKQEVLRDLENMEGSMSKIQFHPELSVVMEQTSKYRGLQFDVNTAMWICVATGQRFEKEKDAAQAAYLHSALQKQSPRPQHAKHYLGSSATSSHSGGGGGSSTQLTATPKMQQVVATASEENWIKDETPEEKLQRRIKQLIGFYEYWDAERQDIVGHVENLFKRHEFTNVSRAVMTKFGVLPPGWEEELQQQDA